MDATMEPIATAPVRALSSEDLRWALAEGWEDFKAKRGDLILLPFIYTVVGALASVLAFNNNLFPLIFPLAGGFALVGPVAAAGFYELARRREAGIDSSWWHFLDPLKGRSRLPIATLTFMLAMIQALIPCLRAVEDALQTEVATLADGRNARHDGAQGVARWGTQRGSIYLADQKLPVTVPRV